MDPTPLAASLAMADQVTSTCYEISTYLYRLRIKHKASSITLRSLETECRTFQSAISRVQRWLQTQHSTSSDSGQVQSVGSALRSMNEAMKDLRSTLADTAERREDGYNTPKLQADEKADVQYVAHEEKFKTQLAELKEYSRLVQLTLNTLQLYVAPCYGKYHPRCTHLGIGLYLSAVIASVASSGSFPKT